MHSIGSNKTVTVNSVLLHYYDNEAKGIPVIFIHGFPFNATMWDLQVKALNGSHRLIAYDVRGHGASEAGNVEFSIELFVSDLITLMDLLKLEKPVLCGLSMGGYIALLAAKEYPERFKGLVLCDTQCVADTPEGAEKRIATIEKIKTSGVQVYAEEIITNLFAPSSFTNRPTEIEIVKQMILATSEESLCNTLRALANRSDTCESLAKFKMPVLIIVGAEDKITPPYAAKELHRSIKGSDLAIIESAGHLSNIEQPEKFNEELKKFLLRFMPDYTF